jgi:peroxiredoxin
MREFAALVLGICGALGAVRMPSQEAKAPDSIRIPLTRKENIVSGVGMGLTFDKESVDKALAQTPVKLPEPLPPGTRVGFNYPDDFFVLFEKLEGRDAAVLTVDANMNRDLTDDAKVEIPNRDKLNEGVIIQIKRSYPGPPPTEARLPYRFVYRTNKNRRGEIEDRIFLSPAYQMEGTFFFQEREYVVELNDFNVLGKFDKSNLSRGTVLRVYPKDEAKIARTSLWGYELISLGNEFYEVRDEALDGSWIELARNTLAHAAIGREVPDFELTDTAGKTFRLNDYRGRYLLLDFWPSWCMPCIVEFPNIKKTAERYANKPLSVVGINLDTEKRLDLARKVIADNALPWPQVLEGKGYFLPIYQILGRLPELRMTFPLYVIIDPEGLARYATNDFRKMERFLEYVFSEGPKRGEVIFVPLVSAQIRKDSSPLPVDFDGETLRSALRDTKLKLPSDLPKETRIGRLPNGTIVIAGPASAPDRISLRLDGDRDLDLTNDEVNEIPVLERVPEKPEAAAEIEVTISYASGAKRFLAFRFFGRTTGSKGGPAEIFYIGQEDSSSGSFFQDDEEYEIRIVDPTCDGLYTPEDTRSPEFVTLKKKKGQERITVSKDISNLPIGGRLFRIRHVHEDGRLIELELISQASEIGHHLH